MKESRIKKLKIAVWLPLLALIIGAIFVAALVRGVRVENEKHAEKLERMNAETCSERMHGELNKGVSLVTTLEQLIISERGNVNSFEKIADNLMTDSQSEYYGKSFIRCLQLAPGGVVSRIYPLEDNEEGMIDLINDKDRGFICRYARDNDKLIIQGPFNLAQGGKGVAIRKPVYLTTGDEAPSAENFWGFAIAIVRVPEIFENSVVTLKTFGYNFELICESVIDGYEACATVYASETAPVSPQTSSFILGGNKWTLGVSLVDGQYSVGNELAVALVGGMLVLSAAALLFLVLQLAQKTYRYKNLAGTDMLTGLLNRAGYETLLTKYLREFPGEPCVEAVLDVDDFKIVNDLYGHGIGDGALKHLAGELVTAFPENSIICRHGGDEFSVVLKGRTGAEAEEELRRFTQAKRTFTHGGKKYNYTVSMGYAEYPLQAKNASELASKSDVALYEAKLRGKHNCFAYNESLRPETRSKLGFALHEVSENLPGAFLIYKADKNDDTMLYANNEMVRLAGCETQEEFMNFCGGRFRNLIRADERERVEASIWEQIDSQRDVCNDYVQFHFATKDGSYRQVFDHGRIVNSVNYGRVFYVLITDAEFFRSHYIEEDK